MPYPFPGNLSVENFLRECWQKKPLLIRNAFPDIRSPLTPNELAGLACEEDVNARIVFEQDADTLLTAGAVINRVGVAEVIT